MRSIKQYLQRWLDAGGNWEQLLNEPIKKESKVDRIHRLIQSNNHGHTQADSIFAGLFIGNLIYDHLRLHPEVIEAINFSRKEDLLDLFDYRNFAERLEALSPESLSGNINQIKGYVGEQVVAQRLQSEGNEVRFPENPNQAGYDLLVNGEPVQVKFSADGTTVQEHLDKYPDIPVITNSDVPSALAEHPMVFPMDGLAMDDVTKMTTDTLDASIELFDYEIPGITFAVAGGRNLYRMVSGSTDAKTGLINTGVELAGRGTGAVVGSKMLSVAGATLGPYGVIVGGVLGAIIGGSVLNRAAHHLKERMLLEAEALALKSAIDLFMSSAIKASEDSIREMEQKMNKLNKKMYYASASVEPFYRYMKTKMKEEKERAYYHLERLKNAAYKPEMLIPGYEKDQTLPVVAYYSIQASLKAKVHPVQVKDSIQRLKDAMKMYLMKLKKM